MRLRPWIFRLLVGALVVAGTLGILEVLTADVMEGWDGVFSSAMVFAVGSICALNCISYTRRRERAGPALIGLGLVALSALGLLAGIWIEPAGGPLELPVQSMGIGALAWAFLLAVFSERLPVRYHFIQHVTAAAIAGLGLTLLVRLLTDWIGEHGDQLTSSLGVASLVGLLVVIALAHHYRSGVRSLVPMAHVLSVPRAMNFYKDLGFQCENSFTPPEATAPTWAWMETPGGAQLMLVCAAEPLIAAQQGVLFYIYCDDLPGKHAELLAKGMAAGPIERPFYAPRGEFRVTDPDGYALMLTHT